MSDEIAVVAIAEAKPGRESEVESAIRACVGPTRQEAGCLHYVAHVDLDAPTRFVFVERWASRAALADHERQPHFLTMAKAFETLLASKLRVLVLRQLP
jgi:quinol monooxygenase YgiN